MSENAGNVCKWCGEPATTHHHVTDITTRPWTESAVYYCADCERHEYEVGDRLERRYGVIEIAHQDRLMHRWLKHQQGGAE